MVEEKVGGLMTNFLIKKEFSSGNQDYQHQAVLWSVSYVFRGWFKLEIGAHVGLCKMDRDYKHECDQFNPLS